MGAPGERQGAPEDVSGGAEEGGGESEDEGLVAEERKRERLVLCRATLVKSSTSECGREAWMRMGKSGVDGIDDPRTSEGLDILDISAWT